MIQRLLARLTPVITLDLRSLAIMRMGMGLGLILDTIMRLQDYSAHYSGQGIFPRGQYLQSFFGNYVWSLFALSDDSWWVLLLFALYAGAGVALLLGWHTRWAALLGWVLAVSLVNRYPLVWQGGGDTLMRLLLLWLVWLPAGRVWSLDALLRPVAVPRHWQWAGLAGLVLLVQYFFMYEVSIIRKTGPEWMPDGTAVYYALHLDQLTKAPAVWLRQFPGLMQALTYFTIFLEGVVPFFLFVPWGRGWLRLAAVLMLMCMHAGFFLTMMLGLFPYTCIVGLAGLLPRQFWQQLARVPGLGFLAAEGPPSGEAASGILRPATAGTGLLLALGVLMFIYNFNYASPKNIKTPAPIPQFTALARIDQRWDMFAPNPLKDDSWWVMDAVLEDSTHADLLAGGGPVTLAKPANLRERYINDRWRKFYEVLTIDGNLQYVPFLCEWYYRQWNRSPGLRGRQIASIYLRRVFETTEPDYKTPKERPFLLAVYHYPVQPPGMVK